MLPQKLVEIDYVVDASHSRAVTQNQSKTVTIS